MDNKCPHCQSDIRMMIEYHYNSPERYDGVSEIIFNCGKRYGRWTMKELKEGEIETRYGEREPYIPDTCECGELKNPIYPTCFKCYEK